jgi:IS5 family transposase
VTELRLRVTLRSCSGSNVSKRASPGSSYTGSARKSNCGRGPKALPRPKADNAAVRRLSCRVEKVFRTWKRSYGLRRMPSLGLAEVGLQVRLAAMAYNLRRTVTVLHGVAA